MGPDQMVLACAFNAMRAEVTKFEATLVALGDRDLEAWEAETIKVRRARGRLTPRRRLADHATGRPKRGPPKGFKEDTNRRVRGFAQNAGRFFYPDTVVARTSRQLLFRSAVS